MNRKSLFIYFIFLMFGAQGQSQNPNWIKITPTYNVVTTALATEGKSVWVGQIRNVMKLNRETGEISYFNPANSGLPQDNVQTICIDKNGSKWFGTSGGGVAKLNGTNWTLYNTSNSALPGNYINSINIDSSGVLWISTSAGVATFNGSTWKVYNTSNSGLARNDTRFIEFDKQGNKWFGIYNGIQKFNDTTWTTYNYATTGISNFNYTLSFTTDPKGNKLVGTDNGYLKFNDTTWQINHTPSSYDPIHTIKYDSAGDLWIGGYYLFRVHDTTWTVFDYFNSGGALSGGVHYFDIDSDSNKWIGGQGVWAYCLVAYREGGVISNVGETRKDVPTKFELNQNYPNPFNPSTTIKYSIKTNSQVSLKVYNTLGQEVSTLVNEEKPAGKYEVTFNASGLSSGVYFYTLRAGSFVETKKLILVK